MYYGASRYRNCAACGNEFRLPCAAGDYPFRMRDQRKDSPTSRQWLYFCNDGCKSKFVRENPRKTYPKYNGG